MFLVTLLNALLHSHYLIIGLKLMWFEMLIAFVSEGCFFTVLKQNDLFFLCDSPNRGKLNTVFLKDFFCLLEFLFWDGDKQFVIPSEMQRDRKRVHHLVVSGKQR